MKPDILCAFEKARKVISSMTLKTSKAAWRYVMLFRDMFGMANFYAEALRTAWLRKMHELGKGITHAHMASGWSAYWQE